MTAGASAAPRTVWVTGAASGMGASHARAFARAGDRVGCWDLPGEKLEALVAELEAEGADAVAVAADVSSWDQVESAGAELREKLGPAEVVVANAGILATGEELVEVDPADWQRVIDVNLTGVFHTAKAAVPQLRDTGGGSLILISSIMGITASPGFAAYNAAKHGVIGLMRTLANELGNDAITVNAICPGWVRTPMLEGSLDELEPGDSVASLTAMNLIDRLVEPEEVTDAVLWLASPGSRMVTGVALPVEGGLMESRNWP